MIKKATWVGLTLSLLALIPVTAGADEWNKKTVLTFSQPVEIPGHVLPAGTYTFKLVDSMSDRHFASLLGPTFPNRSYLMAATSFGHLTTDDTFPPPASTGYKPITGTIFDLLDESHVSWADFYQDAPQGASFRLFLRAAMKFEHWGVVRHPM